MSMWCLMVCNSKTIRHLNDKKPYGEGVDIVKYECVGHVQKRLGIAFKTLYKRTIYEKSVQLVVLPGVLTVEPLEEMMYLLPLRLSLLPVKRFH